jgi:hypothetical protein
MSDMDPPDSEATGTYRHSRFAPNPARRRQTRPAPGEAGQRRAAAPAARSGAVPQPDGTSAETAPAPAEGGGLFDEYGEQWEKRHRRAVRWRRVMTVLRKLSWWIVAIVPLSALAADIGTTMRCELPTAIIDARLRQQWMASWALSTAIVLPLAIFVSLRAHNVIAFMTAVGLAMIWKVAVLLRDRVALPACPRGWSENIQRHALEMPLSLVAAASFAGFLVALAVLAWTPRKSSID